MIHHSSSSFWSAYNALPVSVQKVADQNYELLKDNPKHPSLHFKKEIKGHPPIGVGN